MRANNSGKRHNARLSRSAYSSYHGCVHNTKITAKPKCAFNNALMDSVSIGHAVFSFDVDTTDGSKTSNKK